jgi:hypothetical protein
MSTPVQRQELLGFFELDETGTVLYSNVAKANGLLFQELKGRNFFKEVIDFTNGEELRRRFENFKCESITASTFDFVCHYADAGVPVRVLLARLNKRSEPGGANSVLVHIRKNLTGSGMTIL